MRVKIALDSREDYNSLYYAPQSIAHAHFQSNNREESYIIQEAVLTYK